MYKQPDGNFPNHPANPHDLINFKDLSAKVLESNADLGVFFDGDADRANFVDEKGKVVPIDLLLILLAKEELKYKSGNIYYDLRFSKSFPTFIDQFGGTAVMMRVGNTFYKNILREKGGIFGAEFSGHVMFSENYNIDDGLYLALKIIQMLGKSGKKLSEQIDEVTSLYASPEVSMESKNPLTVFSKLLSIFSEAESIDLDGLYLDFGKNGFISVRQSQSEPNLFRIRVEAQSKKVLEQRFNITKKTVLEG
jgi:phosphomannomutase